MALSSQAPSGRFERHPHFVLRDVGPKQVLVPVRSALPAGVLLLLIDGPVARAVWDALDGSRSVAELVARVVAEFEVPPARAEVDVAAFLEQLLRVGAARRARLEAHPDDDEDEDGALGAEAAHP